MTEATEIIPLAPGARADCLWSVPAYRQRGYERALPENWLRPEVVERLTQAASWLRDEHGIGLLVWDGWRPAELQRQLWHDYRKQLAAITGLEGAALDERTREFVSPPGGAGEMPPHATGGAVDLTLCSRTGEGLDMGGGFDELSDRSSPDYYERGDLSAEETTYRDRRRLLSHAMELWGFRRLPTEWWHFEYGTENWANWTGNMRLFDAVPGPDRSERGAAEQE